LEYIFFFSIILLLLEKILSFNTISGLLDALARGILSDPHVTSSRILGTNITSGVIINSVWWNKQVGGMGGSIRIEEDGIAVGVKPDSSYPW
jgi:G protein-coupled receptor 158